MSTTVDHPRLTWEDLSPRIKGRTGPTADAADSMSTDVVRFLLDALYEDVTPNTGRPGEVVETIDECLAVLHTIRSEAVREARRRLDAAMTSSGRLLERIIAEREANGGTR